MEQEQEISLAEIFGILWNRVWIILISIGVGGILAFTVTSLMITPSYASRMSMYVNNSKDRVETPLNINDINASQKLVATYIEILKSNVVLDKVIEEMGLSYSADQLKKMISASALNGTEILEVTVTSKDPEEAAAIANTLAEVAPSEIIRVVQAGDVALIDKAVPEFAPIAPNTVLNTIIGLLLGGVLSCLVILVMAMLDTRVKGQEDLEKHCNLPVLGAIPDILEAMKA